jgi:hypothetical protein
MPIKTREVTPRMAAANRQNAQKSTGPRTPEGKQRVAYNALQHALYGKPCLQSANPSVSRTDGLRPEGGSASDAPAACGFKIRSFSLLRCPEFEPVE